MTWYSHLDEIKEDLDALVTAAKFPKCDIEVTPAAPALQDVHRMHSRNATMVYLSTAGADDDDEAASPGGTMLVVAHIYTRDGHTAKHGQKYERNRLAALVCEQLHYLLRDPTQYMIDAPTGRTWQMGRGSAIKFRNLSFQGGDARSKTPSADALGLAHWVATWSADFTSEPMNPDTLEDLTSIYVTATGDELGGTPDDGDNETTSVEYP